MLYYFIDSIFQLTKEESNIIYYELINNKNIYNILKNKENAITSKDYDKCIKLIDSISKIIND